MPGYASWTTWTGKCSHAESPPGTRNCDEFCIEIRRESNPRGANLHLIRSSTLTTRPTVYKRLEPNVPITCDRVEDLMRWRFAPRGFDSLRISMQNSSAGGVAVASSPMPFSPGTILGHLESTALFEVYTKNFLEPCSSESCAHSQALHRPSIKGTKLLLTVIKAIIIIRLFTCLPVCLYTLCMYVSMSTSCCKCVDLQVTLHTWTL